MSDRSSTPHREPGSTLCALSGVPDLEAGTPVRHRSDRALATIRHRRPDPATGDPELRKPTEARSHRETSTNALTLCLRASVVVTCMSLYQYYLAVSVGQP
jgi:hypothetical protein